MQAAQEVEKYLERLMILEIFLDTDIVMVSDLKNPPEEKEEKIKADRTRFFLECHTLMSQRAL